MATMTRRKTDGMREPNEAKERPTTTRQAKDGDIGENGAAAGRQTGGDKCTARQTSKKRGLQEFDSNGGAGGEGSADFESNGGAGGERSDGLGRPVLAFTPARGPGSLGHLKREYNIDWWIVADSCRLVGGYRPARFRAGPRPIDVETGWRVSSSNMS
eukprot:CAMPEP_0114518994 /NCGR_PEP_ID=MMETSP0109-20121206/18749_1 /TAXON_ID=29199 /ORGANISM="Chlorarachnion reptans, Strain CCCM449" /LENGTH=157 /DNA_ID=CAMNT_0001699669 /DNA_START=90 /DNA_END=565 /DNA_ORIENTATION=+